MFIVHIEERPKLTIPIGKMSRTTKSKMYIFIYVERKEENISLKPQQQRNQ